MRVGVGFNTDKSVEQLAKYAAAAEQSGFDSFWLHEHSFSRDALSYLYLAAKCTSRIKLGAGCVSAYTRHPVVLAMSFFTLQEMSAGRALMGIGTGFPMRLDLLGIDHSKPVGALKEAIQICRTLWQGDSVSLRGNVFSLKNVKSLPGRIIAPIPVYIAAWKPQMLHLTGAVADGYIAKGGESVRSLKRLVSGIQEAAAKQRRSLEDIDVSAYLLTSVAASHERALRAAKEDPFVCYMLAVQDDYLYEETGIDPALKKPIAENYFRGNVRDAQARVTDEMISAFVLAGTADEVRQRVKEYLAVGLNLPIIQPISSENEEVRATMEAASSLAND